MNGDDVSDLAFRDFRWGVLVSQRALKLPDNWVAKASNPYSPEEHKRTYWPMS
jgi:hypothetical protein